MFTLKTLMKQSRLRWTLLVAMAAALSLLIFAGGAAGEMPEAQAIDDILRELENEFQWLRAEAEADVVWSASKYQQRSSQAPSFVTIITADDIETFGYRTLADVIRSVSGMAVTSNRNYEYIGVRGFQRLGDLNTRVLLLIDGHRLNDTIFQQAMIGGDFPLDMNMVERVEITRGPGSCLYGTNAFFAVINVIPKTGDRLNGLEVSQRVGTRRTMKTRVAAGNALNADAAALLSATLMTSDGEERLYYEEFDDPATNGGAAVNKDGERLAQGFVKFSGERWNVTALYGSREKDVPTASYETAFNEDFSTVDARGYLDVSYAQTFEPSFSLFASLYYDRYIYKGNYPYLIEAEDGAAFVSMNRDDDLSEWIGSEFRVTHDGFKHVKLTAGAEYLTTLHQEMLNYDSEPYAVLFEEHDDFSTWAAYFQGEYRPIFPLIVNAGVRYDWHGSFGGATNPRLALICHPFAATTLKGIYGTAFRAPNMYENYNTENVGSPSLDAERIETWEAIWEQQLSDAVKWLISGYYYTIDGLISQVPFGDDSWTYGNVDDVAAQGVEIELQGRWNNGLTGVVNYTYQHAEDRKTNASLTNSPTRLIKGRLAVPLFSERMTLAASAQYMSERLTGEGNTASAHTVVDLTWRWQDAGIKGLTISASIDNLFDAAYADPVGEENAQDSIEQPGRSARLAVSYLF